MNNESNFQLPTRFSAPGREWLIWFGNDLASLVEYEGIRNADERKLICNLLCRLGLAELLMWNESFLKTPTHREHYYVATKKMRKLLSSGYCLVEHPVPREQS